MKLTTIGFWGGYPKVNEASSGYLLEHHGFNLMIDFGSGVLSKMQNFLGPEQLDAVILSHYHPDHMADIGVLQHARLIQGLLGSKNNLLPIYGHSLNQSEFAKLTYKQMTKGIPFDPSKPLIIGPFQVQFLMTNHPVPCYAMRFEADGKSIVYTADTSFKEEMITFARDANLLLCECNFYSHQDGKSAGHMNSTDAGTLASEASVKQLVLTHLPHYGDLSVLLTEAKKVFKGPISLAKYGAVYSV